MATDEVLRALAPDAPTNTPSEHTGVMVAFGVSMTVGTQLAIPDGMPPEEMHVTLAYLGDAATDDVPDFGRLLQVVAQFSQWNGPVSGVIGGGGIFVHEDDPAADVTAVALVDAPELQAWRARLVDELRFADIVPRNDHGFTPHITLDVGPLAEMQAHPVPPRLALRFDHVAISYAGQVIHLPLLADGGDLALERGLGRLPLHELSVAKAAEARYTLTPLYVPEADDSHGEYVVADDLQRAAWDYFRSGDHDVRLQHLPDTVAGEMVELVTWPYAVVADISTGDGTTKRVTLPPGTVYEGVVWQEWAWEMVKTGKINGLSLGGVARVGEDE